VKQFVLVLILLASEYPSPTIREEQRVMVNGVMETWQLQWKNPPRAACEPSDISLTCPCTGFAYGETGDLDVVRLRDGREVKRLPVKSFFTDAPDSGGAVVQRWQPDYPRLHAFGTAAHEKKPLVIQKVEWEALRDAAGRDTETVLRLSWTGEGISGTMREYSCPGGRKSGKLLNEKTM
jgi:hypothetical protein